MGRQKQAAKAKNSGLYVGRISMTRHGYGFVDSSEGDYYVAHATPTAPCIATGRDQTRHQTAGSGSKRRRRTHRRAREHRVVGRFERNGAIGIVIPADRRLRTEVFIAQPGIGEAKTGDIVVARLTAFPSRNRRTGRGRGGCRARGRAGHRDRDDHSRARACYRVLGRGIAQAKTIKLDVAQKSALIRAVDIRDRFTFTIDPVDARDFDDAITIERVDGLFRLGVHIADVSHYVRVGLGDRQEARQRATSVYLVDRVLPMLPEELSNGICSLNPDEDRLSFTVEMTLDSDAVVSSYGLYPSAMRSDRRFNYDRVQRCSMAKSRSPTRRASGRSETSRALRADRRAANRPRRARLRDGRGEGASRRGRQAARGRAARAHAGDEHDRRGDDRRERGRRPAHARRQGADGLPHPRGPGTRCAWRSRVLKEFDYPIKDMHGATPATFQRIIAFAHTRPEKRLINSLLLRALERARYVDYLDGHFGLASDAYTHFTSPIRRYPDLIVHRLLRAQLAGALETDPNAANMVPELGWLAEHSSVMEREAEMAEDDSVRFKLCELMAETSARSSTAHHGRNVLRAVRPAGEYSRGARARREHDR